MSEVKELKREFIYTDIGELQRMQGVESGSYIELKRLRALIVKVMGSVPFNYNDLVKYGIDYLIKTYRKTYLEDSPDHLNFKHVIEMQINIKLDDVSKAIDNYKRAIAPLGNFKPSLNSKGELITNLKEANFKMYLNEDKREYYKYLKKLLPLALELQQHKEGPVNLYSFAGYVGHGIVGMDSTLVIDNKFFCT